MAHKKFKNEKAFSKWLAKDMRDTYGDKLLLTVNTETGYGASGRLDFSVCFCGAYMEIELKQEGKELTALQEQRAEKVQAAGGWALAPMWPSKVDELYGLLDLIEDLARRNKRAAKQNYSKALESMEMMDEEAPVPTGLEDTPEGEAKDEEAS